MVGSSKRKSKPVKLIPLQRSVTLNSGREERRQKILRGKKYYLDIKNDNTRRKLEESLISLGAAIEVFFESTVNAVVTDRQQWLASLGNTSGPSPSPIPSLSSVNSPSCGTPTEQQPPTRIKTRLDSILEQARLQPQQSTLDPLDDAKKCGVPIYSCTKFVQYVERLKSVNSRDVQPKRRKLRGHFIKIESCDRKHQPFYGEFKRWTFINLNSSPGSCPFDAPPSSESSSEETKSVQGTPAQRTNRKQRKEPLSRVTTIVQPNDKKVKSRSRMTRTGGPKVSGYCEMCNVQYSNQQAHIRCESHMHAQSEVNYLALDALISRGPNMEAFVKLNKVDALNRVN